MAIAGRASHNPSGLNAVPFWTCVRSEDRAHQGGHAHQEEPSDTRAADRR
jgi:hypothetical protein